jgi:protein SCO1/2
MHSQKKAIRITVLSLLVLISLFVGLYSFKVIRENQFKFNKDLFNGTLLENSRRINDFKLQGIDNLPFTQESLVGNWTMIFFGFTNCGYVCPTTMAELGKMYRILESQNIKVLPKVVMITLDPKHDNLDKLSKYVRAFDMHFYGARGSKEMINSMTEELGVAYTSVTVKSADNKKQTTIEHTGAVMLFNPSGKLQAFFTGPHAADKIAEDFKLLVS